MVPEFCLLSVSNGHGGRDVEEEAVNAITRGICANPVFLFFYLFLPERVNAITGGICADPVFLFFCPFLPKKKVVRSGVESGDKKREKSIFTFNYCLTLFL